VFVGARPSLELLMHYWYLLVSMRTIGEMLVTPPSATVAAATGVKKQMLRRLAVMEMIKKEKSKGFPPLAILYLGVL
jgi:hypothetical protein